MKNFKINLLKFLLVTCCLSFLRGVINIFLNMDIYIEWTNKKYMEFIRKILDYLRILMTEYYQKMIFIRERNN